MNTRVKSEEEEEEEEKEEEKWCKKKREEEEEERRRKKRGEVGARESLSLHKGIICPRENYGSLLTRRRRRRRRRREMKNTYKRSWDNALRKQEKKK